MTPEAQRIAIAKACGRVQRPDGFWFPKGKNHGSQGIPDYLNDLNAMHEAELKALGLKYDQWTRELRAICERDRRCIESATAAQRAEAFLRTIGRWENTAAKEDKP
jgi:hypothetical protein